MNQNASCLQVSRGSALLCAKSVFLLFSRFSFDPVFRFAAVVQTYFWLQFEDGGQLQLMQYRFLAAMFQMFFNILDETKLHLGRCRTSRCCRVQNSGRKGFCSVDALGFVMPQDFRNLKILKSPRFTETGIN